MKLIATNIRFLRQLKELTQDQLAIELRVPRSRIGSYEEGRSEPSIDFLIELSKYFKLPIDILVKNNLTLTKDTSFIEIGNQRVLFPIMVDDEGDNIIEVIPIKASAGYLLGYDDPEYIEHLERIKLPFLPTGKHRAFPIKGDSMLPMKNGSYVVARFIEDIRDLKNGNTYIVVTLNNGLVYKRIQNLMPDKKALCLISDNKEYEPFEVPINEVLELWEFTCSINTQEYDEHELKLSSIARMFNDLKVELRSFSGKFT